MRTLMVAVASAAVIGPAWGQSPAAHPSAQAVAQPPERLAARLAAARQSVELGGTLVIVPDERAFLAAVSRWGGEGSEPGSESGGRKRLVWPVLIDDGSHQSREDVARFVRAFVPSTIVRWNGDAPADSAKPGLAQVRAAVQRAWGADDEPGLLSALAARPVVAGPLGVVVIAEGDPAWTGGAALAAAWGQVVVGVTAPAAGEGTRAALGTLTVQQADKLSAEITSALDGMKLEHGSLGDTIDAVTLSVNVPARVVVNASGGDAPPVSIAQLRAKGGEGLATTDLVGRHTVGERLARWAFSSQLFGSGARSAYSAMCSIFLRPGAATAFDGYSSGGDFARYDPAGAVAALKSAGVTCTVIDAPDSSAANWQSWAAGGFGDVKDRPASVKSVPAGAAVPGGLLMVNTMGNSDFFQLAPGICHPGHVPMLDHPAAVHFVHSWSLQHGPNPTAVGGRWIDRGAYVYIGSVHEPYLPAFVTPTVFASRLAGGWPLGLAARVHLSDKSPFVVPWRVGVVGDTLWTIGTPMTRSGKGPDLPGATLLSSQLPALLKERRYAHAVDTLAMLGRDKDAARLMRAALSDEPAKVDIHAALRTVLVAARAGDRQTIAAAAERIDLPGERDVAVADALWHALGAVPVSITPSEAQLLARSIRPSSYAADVELAAAALLRTAGPQAAAAFYDAAIEKAPRPDIKQRLTTSRSATLR